jgi:hypothetical protein
MKWIMVNIMNSQEFSCQILNRDLWSDKEVQKTIRENFYFLQVISIWVNVDRSIHKTNQREFAMNVPIHLTNIHILASLIHELVCHQTINLIIGEQVKSWNKIIQPAEFISEIHEFLERYSLNEQARNPVIKKAKIKKVRRHDIHL